MDEQVKMYIEKYPAKVIELFSCLRQMIFDSVSGEPEEKLWAKLPSYYIGDAFVRLIPFKDHINVEARAIPLHQGELGGYKITPKGMLQLYLNQAIPHELLRQIFAQTLVQ